MVVWFVLISFDGSDVVPLSSNVVHPITMRHISSITCGGLPGMPFEGIIKRGSRVEANIVCDVQDGFVCCCEQGFSLGDPVAVHKVEETFTYHLVQCLRDVV